MAALSRILRFRDMSGLRTAYSEVAMHRVQRAITKMTIKINYSHRGQRNAWQRSPIPWNMWRGNSSPRTNQFTQIMVPGTGRRAAGWNFHRQKQWTIEPNTFVHRKMFILRWILVTRHDSNWNFVMNTSSRNRRPSRYSYFGLQVAEAIFQGISNGLSSSQIWNEWRWRSYYWKSFSAVWSFHRLSEV